MELPAELTGELPQEPLQELPHMEPQILFDKVCGPVDAYWPDDDTWLLATVIEVLEDGSRRLVWDDDDSESVVPRDYVRPVGFGDVSSAVTDEQEEHLSTLPMCASAPCIDALALCTGALTPGTPPELLPLMVSAPMLMSVPLAPIWRRVASRSIPGEYYYFDSVSGQNHQDPPPPWEKRESRSKIGVFFYWNPHTNITSLEKPVV